MARIILVLTVVAIILQFSSCADDDVLVEEETFADVTTVLGNNLRDFSWEEENPIKEMVAYREVLLYSNFGRELWYFDPDAGEAVLLEEDLQTNKLLYFSNGYAYACTSRGIYSFDFSSKRWAKEIDCRCTDLEKNEGRIYFTLDGEVVDELRPGFIYQIEVDRSFTRVTDYVGHYIYDFAIAPDGDFLVFDNTQPKIRRFNRQGILVDEFTEENSPLQSNNYGGDRWSAQHEDKVIFVAESGISTPNMFAWSATDDRWIDYYPDGTELFERESDEDGLFVRQHITSSYTGMVIKDNQILISTHSGGCETALESWNIPVLRPFLREDYEALRFTGERSNCLGGITLDALTREVVTFTQDRKVVYFRQ